MLIYGILWVSECLGKIRGGSRDSEKVCAFFFPGKEVLREMIEEVEMGSGGVAVAVAVGRKGGLLRLLDMDCVC